MGNGNSRKPTKPHCLSPNKIGIFSLYHHLLFTITPSLANIIRLLHDGLLFDHNMQHTFEIKYWVNSMLYAHCSSLFAYSMYRFEKQKLAIKSASSIQFSDIHILFLFLYCFCRCSHQKQNIIETVSIFKSLISVHRTHNSYRLMSNSYF